MSIKVKDRSKLFDETYLFLCGEYAKANPLHFIMLMGMDDELSYDMANYILGHRYKNGCLECVDYHDETDIVEHISQMRFRTVLLLRGLEKASFTLLIPIVRKIEKIIYNDDIPKPLVIEGERTSSGNPMTIPCDEFGTLIINTNSQNILPEYIRKHFEVISLESGNPTGQATPEPQDAAGRPQERCKTNGVTICPIPSGATVDDIEMVFLDDKTVRVTIKNQSAMYNFAQIGFMDKNTGNPNKLWSELTIYAGGNGITNQKDSERINNILQAFFKTKQRLLNRKVPFFKIRNQTTTRNKIPPQVKPRECPSCQERHKHFCKECDEETEHCQECHNEKTHPKLNS